MKLIFVILFILLSVAVFARDLSAIARKERVRRQSIHAPNVDSKAFTNHDLDTYAEHPARPISQIRRETRRSPQKVDRDLKNEESRWRKEKLSHDRELARLDANIRRLEWRLRDRQLRIRDKNRTREDPGVTLMEESLESMREERERRESEFRDRARKAGAFPGWLR